MRRSLAASLQAEEGFTVVGQASDGREAVDLAGKLSPDVVVMDVSMPDMNGVEATAALRQVRPDIHVIGLSMHNDSDTAATMRAAGAVEFLSKSESLDRLCSSIRLCCRI